MVLLKRAIRLWPVSLVALLAQLLAFLLVLMFVAPLGEHFGFSFSSLLDAFLIGGLAAGLGYALGLSSWWLVINVLFAPSLVIAYSFPIEPAWFLVFFAALLAVYWSVFRSRVPLYLTGSKAMQDLSRLLPEEGEFRFVDLGAGTGRVLSYLASVRPDGRYTGIESAPLPFLLGRRAAARGKWSWQWGDFWGVYLGRFDVIYAYLSPAPMPRLLDKLKKEMQPEALFISNTFALPGATPSETVELADIHRSTLYLYRYDDIIMAKKVEAT
jgi:SAM-dependent methyltransferase